MPETNPRPHVDRERRDTDHRVEMLTNKSHELERRIATNEKAIALIVETSVAEGIKAAVGDPATWDAFFAALGNRAQNEAGSVVMGGVKWVGRRIFWWSLACIVVYYVGGWDLLIKVAQRAH